MNQMRSFLVRRQRTLRVALMLAFALAAGSGAFAAEAGNNLPWEGPLTTLVTSLTGRSLTQFLSSQSWRSARR